MDRQTYGKMENLTLGQINRQRKVTEKTIDKQTDRKGHHH